MLPPIIRRAVHSGLRRRIPGYTSSSSLVSSSNSFGGIHVSLSSCPRPLGRILCRIIHHFSARGWVKILYILYQLDVNLCMRFYVFKLCVLDVATGLWSVILIPTPLDNCRGTSNFSLWSGKFWQRNWELSERNMSEMKQFQLKISNVHPLYMCSTSISYS